VDTAHLLEQIEKDKYHFRAEQENEKRRNDLLMSELNALVAHVKSREDELLKQSEKNVQGQADMAVSIMTLSSIYIYINIQAKPKCWSI
jgi:hypothetical protein